MLWVVLALLALIIALLAKIIADLRRLIEAGAHDGPTATQLAGMQALQDALQLVQSLSDEQRRPTAAECQRLKELLETAQDADLSALSLNPLLEALERLCP